MRVSSLVAAIAFGALLAFPGAVSAESITGASYDDVDVAVLDELTTMLDAPMARREARKRDHPARLAAAIDSDVVIVVHVAEHEVHVFDVGRHRHALRVLDASLEGSAYTVAGIAYELLELVRTAPDGAPEVSEEVAPPEEDGSARLFAHVDGFRVGVGGRLGVSVDGDALLFDLVGSLEVTLRTRKRLLFPIGLLVAGLGRDKSGAEESKRDVAIDFRRTDVFVRVGIGRRLERTLLFAHLEGGLENERLDTDAKAGGGSPASARRERHAGGFVGLVGEVRRELPRGFALTLNTGVDFAFRTRDYQALGLLAFHDSAVRLTFGAGVLWGRPSR